MKQIVILCLVTMIASCNSSKMSTVPVEALPPVIVYKTSGDYCNLVPITLNETKDKVISYPAPSDLYMDGKLALPLKLEDGYLFDQRGIHANSVFTTYTYEAYSKMESAPSIDDLMSSIKEKDPFVEIYNCGKMNQFKNLEKDLNRLIRKNFKGCIKL